ncbi:hypothetical protein ACFVW2_01155 [Streptomyces sp. NPDC058171]
MTTPSTPPTPPQPQPPHDQPPAEGGWGTPPSGPPSAGPGESGEGTEPGLREELREAAVITVAVAAAGVLLGLLWLWLAPRVPLVSDADAVYLGDTEGEQAIGIDGTFTLLAIGFGALSALAVFLWRKRGGIPLVVALAVGSLLGGLLAWRLGVWLGPTEDVVAHAKEVGKGVTFDAPLKLEALGTLLVWPVTALLLHLCLTALFAPRDPDPYDLPLAHGPGPWDRPPAAGGSTGSGVDGPVRDPYAPPPQDGGPAYDDGRGPGPSR